jgi:ribosomal protein L35
MPKMKAHSGAKKRFKPTGGNTKIKRRCQNKNDLLNGKPRQRIRTLRRGGYIGPDKEKAMRTLLCVGGKPKKRKTVDTAEGGNI